MKQHSERFRRERKMMLFLPILVIPMLALAFYGLGGGKSDPPAKDPHSPKGLNTNLPVAHFNAKEKELSKLEAYKKADLDAARMRDRIKEDPYYSGPLPSVAPDSIRLLPIGRAGPVSMGSYPGSPGKVPRDSKSETDSQASQLLRKLETLKAALNPGMQPPFPVMEKPALPGRKMPAMINGFGKPKDVVPDDPQLEKLGILLDKILRIQHPGEENGSDTAHRREVAEALVVNLPQKDPAIKLLDDGSDRLHVDDAEGFQEITGFSVSDSAQENLIVAVIDQDAVLMTGSTVVLRLVQDAQIGGTVVSRNSLLSGKVSVSGERFLVSVNSIRVGQTMLPVTLEVYDQDGLPGIRIPGAIGRDVSKESADAALSGLGLATLDPSLGVQAANAGLQAAKTFASRKTRAVRGTVSAGYRVYLKNAQRKF